ncbi:MAG: fumarylacetoacetase, partial [Aeromicrobium sp.]
AHMTRNGASLRTGDIYGTGTVSSFEPSGQGSLMELSWGGSRPLVLEDGTERTFLEDGDDVSLRALIGGDPARPFGEATGTVVARPDC